MSITKKSFAGYCVGLIVGLVMVCLTVGCLTRATKPRAGTWIIHNPYAAVDWKQDDRYKANFHTHTTQSDGAMTPANVVDRYRRLGYQVLALTDHDHVSLESDRAGSTNRGSEVLGMVIIQGNELSKHHHLNSFFNDHNNTRTMDASLNAIATKTGLAMLNHPGRYQMTIDWYVDLYRRYSFLFGLEVYNQGDRYPGDRTTWDAMLTQLMPDRPVWGLSNDDMHNLPTLGRNWTILLMPKLTSESVRQAMTAGRFYYVYSPAGHDGPPVPSVDAIDVDSQEGVIRLHATACTQIVWIAEGREIQRGASLKLAGVVEPVKYVRAVLYGASNSVAGTQPFGLSRSNGASPSAPIHRRLSE